MKHFNLTSDDHLALERELCARSLADFAKMAWNVLEPATPLKWGWALDAICTHLEALTNDEIWKLLMNVPPGTMKSLMTGVIWPAWEWGPKNRQSLRYIGTAHKGDLAVRDAMKCRRLIQSRWFQERWPVTLVGDQNAKTKFENDKTGFREAMPFTSMTGARGDRILLDDPLSADAANSEAELRAAELAFTEALPTRLNSEDSAIVVIMQRLHENDTSGIILSRDLGYIHLCLPMRFEIERRCKTFWFTDPRTKDGELLFPQRFSEQTVRSLEHVLGSYASAGQLQQRPTPRGGSLFKKEWFQVTQAAPADCTWVRGWDLAATKSDNAAYTVGVLMGRAKNGVFYIADVKRIQGTYLEVERLLEATAEQDDEEYGFVQGSIPQDPGQAGKAQAQHLISKLAGRKYRATLESGDKVTRAGALSAQLEAGNVVLVAGDWNQAFIDEFINFPASKFKDQVDASSRAFHELTSNSKGPVKVGTLKF